MTSQDLRSRVTARRPASRGRELVVFLVLAFGIWPILAVAVVGGFGFLLWMYQILTGPPGPPPG